MKVQNYTVRNVLGVNDIKFDLEGRNLFLVGGRNGQGKTSSLKAFTMTMCGRRESDDYPEIALKDGEREGFVEINLSGPVPGVPDTNALKIKLHLKRRRDGAVIETFTIVDEQGDEASEPRALLKKLYQMRGFDPLSFRRLDRKAKLEQLKSLVGLDFTAEEEERKKLYDERTGINRDLKSAEARLAKMPHYPDAPKEKVATKDLMDELDRRKEVNTKNAKARADAKKFKDEQDEAGVEVTKLKEQIAALQAKLVTAEARQSACVKRTAEQLEIVSKLVDEDIKEIRDQIDNADPINEKVQANLDRAKAEADIDALGAKADKLTAAIEKIDQEKQDKIAAAKWPVPGLSVDADGVMYEGLPIEQINTAKATLVSTEIGIALNPELRLFVCEGGSDLDFDTLKELDRILKEKDFQMIVETLTRTAEDDSMCSVVIKDGRIATEPATDDE